MIKLCKLDQESVIRQVTNGSFDNVALSESNLADDIILSMYEQGILGCLSDSLKDKRRINKCVPSFWLNIITSHCCKDEN